MNPTLSSLPAAASLRQDNGCTYAAGTDVYGLWRWDDDEDVDVRANRQRGAFKRAHFQRVRGWVFIAAG